MSSSISSSFDNIKQVHDLGPVHMERAGLVKWVGSVKRDLTPIVICTEKVTCVYMRSGPVRLAKISEISASRDGNFSFEHIQASQPV